MKRRTHLVLAAACLAVALGPVACESDSNSGSVEGVGPDIIDPGDIGSAGTDTVQPDDATDADGGAGESADGAGTPEPDAQEELDGSEIDGEADGGSPDGEESDAGERDVVEPDTSDPDTNDPDATDPDATDPDTSEPDSADPDTTDPDTTDPDTDEPDVDIPPGACGDCPWDEQPAGDHPGGSAALEAVEVEIDSSYGPGGDNVLVARPTGTGPFPVIGFLPGKQLFEGFPVFLGPGELGYAYRTFIEHIASKGYIVVFPQVETDLLDADHARMADDFLDILQYAIENTPKANPAQVAYAGHSMGAKVALIAAGKATALDGADDFTDPTAVFLMSFENSAPPVGEYIDANTFVEAWSAEPVWVTFLHGNDDAIAPWDGTEFPQAQVSYQGLGAAHKQFILLHGTGSGDPNPSTSPELVDDHASPLSIVGKNGGLADFATPDSYLDALDWYGYWKIVVGGLDFHFKGGSVDWAYGDLRTHGGELPDGTVLEHEILGESL